jgi:hypothetical protein
VSIFETFGEDLPFLFDKFFISLYVKGQSSKGLMPV